MRLGSGNTTALLQGKNTGGFKKLLIDFIADEPQNRNALNSTIHALRTGAILEEVMYKYLPDTYMSQVRVQSEELDVLTSTLDFAILDKGKVMYFIEMKTVNFNSFLEISESTDRLEYIKKKYKNYYNQVQQQMLVTGLKLCTLMFVVVYDENNDSENWNREIKKNEIIEIKVPFDENVSNKIKERAIIFQQIKDYLNEHK